jgi:histidinol-phosphate phosphatase family protein
MQSNISILKGSTLFIDRDGVINVEKKEDYIYTWEEFVFYPNVLKAFKIFAHYFDRIIVITNQRGVGKGKMSEEDLLVIHANMQKAIEAAGSKIDAIFYCTDVDNTSPNRKPNAGMALQAKAKFPEIDFTKTFMVGNKMSDMLFAKNAGVQSVFIATTNPETPFPHPNINYRYNDVYAFAQALTKS